MENKTMNRADQLQFLRCLAFFLIFLWHSDYWSIKWFPHDCGAANAVSFFFIISGLVTGYSSFYKNNTFSVGKSISYILKKIKKFYPLYFVTTFFMIIYTDIPFQIDNHEFGAMKGGIVQLLKNLLLIQSWFPSGYFSFNGVGWFLSSIMFLYLITIPILACANQIKKLKHNLLIFTVIFALVSVITVSYCYLLRNYNVEFWEYVFPPARIGEYVLGICLAYMVLLVINKTPNNIWVKAVFTFAEVASLVFWVYRMYVPIVEWQYRIVHWLLPNIILLCVFTFGKGYISKLFLIYPLKRLGDISFECFLIHPIVLLQYTKATGIVKSGGLSSLFSLIFCLIATILTAEVVSKTKTK